MKTLNILTILVFIALFLSADTGLAAEVELDITMTVVTEGAEPDAVMKMIELPKKASAKAKEKAQTGLNKANEVRGAGEETTGETIEEPAEEVIEEMEEVVEEQAEETTEATETVTDPPPGNPTPNDPFCGQTCV